MMHWVKLIRSKMLKSLPGGPARKIFRLGDKIFKLPEPIINKSGCNLSFVGKTAVLKLKKLMITKI